MSPAFVNRFDVIVLEDQMENLADNEKKELITFLLINSYKENKIKSIIEKQQEIQQKEKEEMAIDKNVKNILILLNELNSFLIKKKIQKIMN